MNCKINKSNFLNANCMGVNGDVLIIYLLLLLHIICDAATESLSFITVKTTKDKIESSYFKNPCGAYVTHTRDSNGTKLNSPLPLRIKDFKKVKFYLKMANETNHRINNTEFTSLYKTALKTIKGGNSGPNSPYDRCKEYEQFTKSHPSQITTNVYANFLPTLYMGLMLFGKAFDELHSKRIPIESSETEMVCKRLNVLTKYNANILFLSCEIETIMQFNDMHNSVGVSPPMSIIDGIWPKPLNLSSILAVDQATYAKFDCFLADWLNILRNLRPSSQKKNSRLKRPFPKRRLSKRQNIGTSILCYKIEMLEKL